MSLLHSYPLSSSSLILVSSRRQFVQESSLKVRRFEVFEDFEPGTSNFVSCLSRTFFLVSPRFHERPMQRVGSREENDGRRSANLGVEAYLGIGVTKMLADTDLRLVLAQ